ncbi:MAG: permease [Endomicrobiaceae bacterium]|nr:permease [Endomicrobiaceae bacterium]
MQYFNIIISLFNEMAPYLLLGFFFAGILHVFVPQSVFSKYLSKNNFASVLTAALFGVPLPLCSCGVIPTAMALRKEGASKGSVISFLIATPQTGVDSIMATYSLMGLPFAIIRPIAAFCTAVFGGFFSNIFIKNEQQNNAVSSITCAENIKTGMQNKIKEVFKYGFVDILQDIGKWLILGILIAGVITYFVPDSFFQMFSDNLFLSILFVLILAVPMYMCATGSIPIAIALMMKGISPGTAFVLLMAGPATNIVSILIIGKVLGRRTLILYLLSIISGSIAFALIIDFVLPPQWFALPVTHEMLHSHHADSLFWFKTASGIILFILILSSFILKYFSNIKKVNTHTAYKIDGMRCNNCRINLVRLVKEIEGVKSAEADLNSGTLYIDGNPDEEKIKEAAYSLGYTFKGKIKN